MAHRSKTGFAGLLRAGKSLMNLKRAVQAAFFILFLYLLVRTEYHGLPEILYPVNAFFQADPFLGTAVALVTRSLVTAFWPALIVVLASLLLGRVFCGWVCPLGALLDFSGRWRRGSPYPVSLPAGPRRHLKYLLLAGALAAAVLGLQWAWLPDPFSILGRGFAVSVIPAADRAARSLFDFVYFHARPLAAVTEPVYSFLARHVLPYGKQSFLWGWASLALLGLVLAGEVFRPRFWCRYLCPLGAMISFLSRRAPMRRRVGEKCVDCGACYDRCHLGLINEANHRASSFECSACLACRDVCPHGAISFAFGGERGAESTPSLSRRRLLGGVLAGAAAVPFFRSSASTAVKPPGLLRPPGSRGEREFLDRCIRCGSCMKVCMGNAIHPALLEAGAEGIMTPVMAFRLGYCEYNCTLCGQVCPTGAVEGLDVPAKHRFKIGEAFVDKNRCIPYVSPLNCIVCEEHCPVPDKAIRFQEFSATDDEGRPVTVKRPEVVEGLCIGCGICETKCPVEGRAAIRVTKNGESRGGWE